jgi:hypothetical protein
MGRLTISNTVRDGRERSPRLTVNNRIVHYSLLAILASVGCHAKHSGVVQTALWSPADFSGTVYKRGAPPFIRKPDLSQCMLPSRAPMLAR